MGRKLSDICISHNKPADCKHVIYRTVSDIAGMYQCCVRTIYALMRKGNLNYIQIGNTYRIPVLEADWKDYLREKEEETLAKTTAEKKPKKARAKEREM